MCSIILLDGTDCPLVTFPRVSITEAAKRLKDLELADAIYSVSKILSGSAGKGINQGTAIYLLKLTIQTV